MESDRYLITLINLGIIFFPGIIGTFILMRFRPCKHRTLPYFFLYSYVIGIIAFACVPIITVNPSYSVHFPSLNYFLELGKGNWTFLQGNVFCATVWAVIIIILFSIVEKNRLIARIAAKCRISNRFEDDIWNYTHNLLIQSKWVKWTDHKEQLVYVGTLEAFSDTFRDAELMLTNVYVYDINDYGPPKAPMTIIPNLYVTLDPQNIKIEFH